MRNKSGLMLYDYEGVGVSSCSCTHTSIAASSPPGIVAWPPALCIACCRKRKCQAKSSSQLVSPIVSLFVRAFVGLHAQGNVCRSSSNENRTHHSALNRTNPPNKTYCGRCTKATQLEKTQLHLFVKCAPSSRRRRYLVLRRPHSLYYLAADWRRVFGDQGNALLYPFLSLPLPQERHHRNPDEGLFSAPAECKGCRQQCNAAEPQRRVQRQIRGLRANTWIYLCICIHTYVYTKICAQEHRCSSCKGVRRKVRLATLKPIGLAYTKKLKVFPNLMASACHRHRQNEGRVRLLCSASSSQTRSSAL